MGDLLACCQLGLIIDAEVFVFWFSRRDGYTNLMTEIKNEAFYIVICPKLLDEYVDNLVRESVGSYYLLSNELDKLSQEIDIKYPCRIPDTIIPIKDDDQHVLDCALNSEYEVHLIIVDNQDHFISDLCGYNLPVLISTADFLEPSCRHTACAEAKRASNGIRSYGKKYRFTMK